ncbi:MAG: CotH kinase family protein, partial [Flavobacteriales bacterium]
MNSFSKLICLSILSFGLAYSSFAQDFYDVSTVQTIEVTFSQSNWDQLMDNAKSTTGDYIMAQTVAINGEVLDSVGVKFKGNSSYNANQAKNPWHIELNTYKDQDYQGYKDIKLSNGHKDPSFLRDVLGFQIARQYMDAPKSNFTNLYVNGVLIGLYTNTESITKAFVDDRFDSKDNSFFNCSPPAGAGPGLNDFPNLEYLGADSANYYDSYDMKSAASWQDLIDLCDTLKNHNTSIENLLDVDRALWMLAFDNAIVNLDSYIGQFKQNYYLYRDDFGRFLPIVWDLNESFGTFSGTGSGNLNSTIAKQQMDHLLHSSDTDFPLFSQLMAIPTYKKMYLAHIKTIMSENFSPDGTYFSMAQAIQNTASSSYQNDPNTAYTYNQFILNLNTDVSGGGGGPGGGNAPGITNLMNGRYSHLFSQSDFTATQPNISDITLSNPAPTTGGVISITAKVNDAENVYLRHRNQDHAPFAKTELFDDGNHNDGAAGDNIYGADLNITSIKTDYYIYAENSTIGRFSPARAQHEFYSINVTGGITPGDIVINEFMASNNTTVSDSDGE